MRLLYFTTILLLPFLAFSQESIQTCAEGKAALFLSKSASLNNNQIRLTEKFDVKHYKLNLEMTNTSTAISGTVEMTARARVAMDTIMYELFQSLNISEIRVNDSPVAFTRVQSAIIIEIPVLAGSIFKVSTTYSGTPPTAATNPLGGSGMTNGTSPTWGNQVTWSLSQPFSAYEWWPCKQSLRDKIDSLDVWITVPSTCKAGSNGLLKNVVDVGNGKSRYEWKHRHPIDYYLVSVAVARYIEFNVYAHPEGTTDSILIQNFIYDNPATLQNFQADIEETADFLELFSELFGPYPFPDEKYGHCMAPLGGGMEHQTMTTQGSFNRTLTAHELGHQWFGDHVTCASWADIWVNEGFARYCEYLMLERLYPGQEVTAMTSYHTNIMQQNGGAVWVSDSLNGSRLFSSRLTYNKGGAILHTFRYLLNNDSTFFRVLKKYQTRFADSTAIGTDFQRILEEESGIDFSEPFEQWYFGEGFPTYTARWNNVNGDLHLRISHTVSMASVTPTFTTPLEIQFKRTGMVDTIIRFPVSSNSNTYIVSGMGNVSSIFAVDPNNWIINRVGLTTRDNSLVVTSMVNEIAQHQAILFPNPTRDRVTIKSNNGFKNLAKVFDSRGKLFLEHSFTGDWEFSLEDKPSGLYLIQLTEGDGVKKTHRIIRK